MDVPGLPIDKAADALLGPSPTLGPIVIFMAAAIVFLVGWIIKMTGDHRKDLAVKDKKIEEINQKLVEVLMQVIPAIRDMKELAVDMATHARGRTVK